MNIFDDSTKPYLIAMLGVIVFIFGFVNIPRFIRDENAYFTSALNKVKTQLKKDIK